MPDDHSEVAPLLPIPNRTVKRLCANDSADSRVKVGHRQAPNAQNAQSKDWAFFLERKNSKKNAKRRARIQGFADHSEEGGKVVRATEWIIKNIQPISVGV